MSRTVKNVLYTILPLIMFLFATIMVVGIFAATTASVNVEMNMQYEVPKGSGTVSDPYIIEALGSNSDSAKRGTFNYYARNNMFTAGTYFKQVDDITISDSIYLTNLSGTYNGNGHTITVTGATTPLFDTITGTLKNVTIINENSTADAGVCLQLGNYSADAGAGTIENVIFKGNITSSSYEPVGGIVKRAGGGAVIKNCGNYADITASNSTSVAGLVAISEGDTSLITIENCFNQGNISCGDTGASYVAGILSNVTSPNGIIATVKNCYNTGSIQIVSSDGSSVSGYAGGIIGGSMVTTASVGATLEKVYNYSTKVVGGSKGSLATSFYDDTVPYDFTYHSYALEVSSLYPFSNYSSLSSTVQGYFESKSSTLMQTKSTYSGWTFGTYGQATDGWVFAYAKIKVDGTEQTLALPRLWFEELEFGPENGSQVSPYTISSADDFNKYATSSYFGNSSYYFVQTADITTSSELTQTTLLGNYDGDGHTINFTGSTTKSLFLAIGSTSVATSKLRNLTVNVSNSSVSAICTNLYGTIERIITKGTISSSGTVGGLVYLMRTGSKLYQCANYANITSSGGNTGGLIGTAQQGSTITIDECANFGNITYSGTSTSTYVGGLIPYVQALTTVTNSYNAGNVTGYRYVGGIVGYAYNASTSYKITIANCYSIASSIVAKYASGNKGGIIGNTYSTTSSYGAFGNNYFRSGAGATYGNGRGSSYSSGCTSKTYAEMQVQSLYANSSTTINNVTYTYSFGTAGTSTTGWVWVNKPIIIGGTSVTISLPRLAWEFLN